MKIKAKIVAAVVTVLAAVFTFAANVFAAAPCFGPYYEPKMPEKLRKK